MRFVGLLIAFILVAAACLWAILETAESPEQSPIQASSFGVATPSAVAEVTAPRSALISGRVTKNQRSIEGARVEAMGTHPFSVVTDASGAFTLEVEPGSYVVSAEDPFNHAVSDTAGPIQLIQGQHFANLSLQLAAGSALTFHLIDLQSRRPLAQVSVLGAHCSGLTDVQGDFTCTVGKSTRIQLMKPGYLMRNEWITNEAPAPKARAEITLTPSSFVEGTVTSSGAPVFGATVRFGEGPVALTKSDGSFVLETAATKGRLIAVSAEGLRAESAPFVLAIGERKKDLVLDFGAVTAVQGIVTKAGIPISQAQVALIEAKSEALVQVVSTDEAGRFVVPQIMAGASYVVQVRRVNSVVSVGPFLASQAIWKVDVPDGKRLFGRVDPPQAGVVINVKNGAWAGPPARTVTTESGEFSFEDVPDEVLQIDAEGPAGEASLRASPGAMVVITLESLKVRVTVQDSSGAPLSEGVLSAKNHETAAVKRQTLLVINGLIEWSLPRGLWGISFEAPGRGRSAEALVDMRGPTVEVQLMLEATVALRGCVRDAATGLPLPGARVMAGRGMRVAAPFDVGVETNSRGEYQLPAVPLSGQLLVLKPNYARQVLAIPSSGVLDIQLIPSKGDPGIDTGSGTFEGIGMVLDQKSPRLVTAVNPQSPAERAGVQPGDEVMAINGVGTDELSLQALVERIRGPAGTAVQLRFRRRGEEFNVSVRRRELSTSP
jgi:hypothetical protein